MSENLLNRYVSTITCDFEFPKFPETEQVVSKTAWDHAQTIVTEWIAPLGDLWYKENGVKIKFVGDVDNYSYITCKFSIVIETEVDSEYKAHEILTQIIDESLCRIENRGYVINRYDIDTDKLKAC